MEIKILIADDSEETRRSLRTLLEMEPHFKVIGEAENGAVAVEKTIKLEPDLVLMDINMPVLNGLLATEKITVQCPKTAVVICSVQGERDYLRQAMTAGAKDFLVKPISTDQLLGAVQNIYALEKKRQVRVKSTFLEEQMVERSQVLSFISAKGGVGKTTIAVNIATAAAKLGKRVCLVDLDLQFGDTALLMSLTHTRRNLYQMIHDAKEMDSEVLGNYLLEHESGVKVLAAPVRPEQSEYITAEHVAKIVPLLGEMFELVIVDTAPVTNDVFFSVLEHSDQIGLVTTPSLPILKNNHNLLQLLLTLGTDEAKIRVLLNRSYAKTGVRARDVSEVLKRDIDWELPNDFQFVDSSVNEGVPFVFKQPNHRLSKQMEFFVRQWLGLEKRRFGTSKQKKSRFKLFG